jgi:hypothetical protein
MPLRNIGALAHYKGQYLLIGIGPAITLKELDALTWFEGDELVLVNVSTLSEACASHLSDSFSGSDVLSLPGLEVVSAKALGELRACPSIRLPKKLHASSAAATTVTTP